MKTYLIAIYILPLTLHNIYKRLTLMVLVATRRNLWWLSSRILSTRVEGKGGGTVNDHEINNTIIINNNK
jgi:hypothetical protein